MSDDSLKSIESAINDQFGMHSAQDTAYYRQLREFLQVRRIFGDAPNMVRVGKVNDGGYVMLDDFKAGGNAYSFGISSEVSWDSDMADKGYDIYMYDHTIDKLPYEKKGFHFFKQGLAGDDSAYPLAATVSRYIRENGHTENRHMILKMDVEGAEWDWLMGVDEDTLDRFDQIVMEMHWFTKYTLREKILTCIKKLGKTHALLHLHGSNYARTYWMDGVQIPDVMELLWVNCKTYDVDNAFRSRISDELDSPNNELQDEISLAGWEAMTPSRHAQSEFKKTSMFCVGQEKVTWNYMLSVQNSKWLQSVPIESMDDRDVDFCYLYLLHRILEEHHPQVILEFNFGQATKLTAQYAAAYSARHVVLENNRERVEHFISCWKIPWENTKIYGSPLLKAKRDGNELAGVAYSGSEWASENQRYNLILLKCPFVDGIRIHMDIPHRLPGILGDDFGILMDHTEDCCSRVVLQDMADILKQNNIDYVRKDFQSSSRSISILASKSWKYVEEF